MATEVLNLRSPDKSREAVERAVRSLREGGLVGFPTETVYGVAALAGDGKALARLREIKDRPARPFSVHVADSQDVHRYVRRVPWQARQILHKGWPGPITLLLETDGSLADEGLQKAGLYDRLCSDGVIGLRCPDVPAVRDVFRAVGEPVVAPSANRIGRPSPRSAEDVLAGLDGQIDLLLDGGPTRHGQDSTIVRFHGQRWTLVRQGVYDERTVRRLTRISLLMLCTGNTCRSPIAAGLAKQILAERLGCRVGELRSLGVEVHSAGLAAGHGGKATGLAVLAARELGADISRHRSHPATGDLIESADVVFCMTQRQVMAARHLAPAAAGHVVRLLENGDISDPIGGDERAYRDVASRIRNGLITALDKRFE